MAAFTVKELKEITPKLVTPEHIQHFPDMTSWFDPRLLFKLLQPVILSDLFGQYADRRLTIAALDPATSDEHFARATNVLPEGDDLWIDYLSDTGDGFDPTYAVAYAVAQPEIKIGNETLKRGQVLVMGGDEVYPTALRDDYILKMRKPFQFALPDDGQAKIPLFALPGNHDWYDGLVMFSALFCREKPIPIGRWTTPQRRSYFAAQLTKNVWLWGIDIALVRDFDQPQADYFFHIAERMAENSSIILCSAEPGWYEGKTDGASYRTLSYAANIANNAKRQLKIPLILSGDSHHYARYQTKDTQYITSGGGGAFSHGTLQLKQELDCNLFTKTDTNLHLKQCYPTKEQSQELLWWNILFAPMNRWFSFGLGVLYWLASIVYSYAPRYDIVVIEWLILTMGLWGYSHYQESEASKKRTFSVAAVNAAAHTGAIAMLTTLFTQWSNYFPAVQDYWLSWIAYLAALNFTLGAAIAGTIFGINLFLSCRFLNMNHNDAFSSLCLKGFKHFLRIKISKTGLTVYPIKIEKVPERDAWRKNENPAIPSVFVADGLSWEFIEAPISISLSGAITTKDVVAKSPPTTA